MIKYRSKKLFASLSNLIMVFYFDKTLDEVL